MNKEKQNAAPEDKQDTTQEYVIDFDFDESDIAEIEAQAAKNAENWVPPDTNFVVFQDGEEQALIICPSREDARSIKLGKKTAVLLIEIIRRQVQNWS